LRNCSLKLKDFPKWQKSFKAWCKHDKKCPEDSTIDLEEDVGLSKNMASKDQPKETKQARLTCTDKLHPLQRRTQLRTVFTKKVEAMPRGMKRDAWRRRSDTSQKYL
jgi:hypothetical protein